MVTDTEKKREAARAVSKTGNNIQRKQGGLGNKSAKLGDASGTGANSFTDNIIKTLKSPIGESGGAFTSAVRQAKEGIVSGVKKLGTALNTPVDQVLDKTGIRPVVGKLVYGSNNPENPYIPPSPYQYNDDIQQGPPVPVSYYRDKAIQENPIGKVPLEDIQALQRASRGAPTPVEGRLGAFKSDGTQIVPKGAFSTYETNPGNDLSLADIYTDQANKIEQERNNRIAEWQKQQDLQSIQDERFVNNYEKRQALKNAMVGHLGRGGERNMKDVASAIAALGYADQNNVDREKMIRADALAQKKQNLGTTKSQQPLSQKDLFDMQYKTGKFAADQYDRDRRFALDQAKYKSSLLNQEGILQQNADKLGISAGNLAIRMKELGLKTDKEGLGKVNAVMDMWNNPDSALTGPQKVATAVQMLGSPEAVKKLGLASDKDLAEAGWVLKSDVQ